MAFSYRSERRKSTIFKLILNIILTILLILLQLIIYYLLIFQIHNIPYIAPVSVFISLIVVSQIYNSDNNISYKLSWTVVCLLFNLGGSLLYLVYANGNSLPKRKNKKIQAYLKDKIITNNTIEDLKEQDLIGYKHASILNASTDGYQLYNNTNNTFFNDGNTMYLDMLEKIKNARKFIFLEFFIISEGSVFDEVINILIEKANNGIEIKIIFDAVGSGSSLKRKTIKRLNSIMNIELIAYNPLSTTSATFNYRDHRKIVVIDGIFVYTGGMNLADEYVHRKNRFGYWRDNGILIEGEPCYTYTLLFAQNWYMSTKKMLLIEDYKPIYEENKNEGYIFPFGDGPNSRKSPSYDLFLSLINNAQKSIYISTPYFVIDSDFIKAITNAIKSGIDVKILIPNIPDKKIFFPVTLAHLKNIIISGGEVYKFTPGFNHAKTIVVDNRYAFIGTVNVDYRSLFLHFECGSLLINTSTVQEIQKDFINAVNISNKINIEDWKKRPFKSKIQAFILTLIGPLL